MLGPYRQADSARIDMLHCKLGRVELRVCGRCGMDDKAFHIGDIGQQREYLERVYESPGCLTATLELDGEYRSGTAGEIAIIESVVGMAGKRGMVDFPDLGMTRKAIGDLHGIGDMALDAQRQCLKTLQQEKAA